MGRDQTLTARDSLRHQALRRLVLVMAISMLGIAAVGIATFTTIYQRDVEKTHSSLEEYFRVLLPRTTQEWQMEAARTRTRIEMTRVLEGDPARRWEQLSALLNAQWEYLNFTNLIITRQDGTILYRYGSEAHAIGANAWRQDSDWHLSSGGDFYRLIPLPIWLGQEGTGQIILFKAVNNALLGNLSFPNTRLYLQYGDSFPATSPGATATPPTLPPARLFALERQAVRVILPWQEGTDAPRLWVDYTNHNTFPMGEFLLRPVGVILFISVLFWLGFGRWLSYTVRRVESLERATRRYTESGAATAAQPDIQQAIGHGDEVQDLARALGEMMREIERRTHAQHHHLETLSLLEEAVLELDGSGRIVRASPGWQALTLAPNAGSINFHDLLNPEDADSVRSHFRQLAAGQAAQVTLRMQLRLPPPKHHLWIEARFIPNTDHTGAVVGIRGVLRDITQNYLHEKQISHMALHDNLTGLPNRMLFEDRAKVALHLARRNGHRVGICFIDLDHFKTINDTLGHKIGDKLLIQFTHHLLEHLRAGDTLARWGGDEFILLLPDMEDEVAIMQVADKIKGLTRAALQVDDTGLNITFSMGMAIYPDDGEDVDTLLVQADRAMFHAKAQGRNQISLCRETGDHEPERRQLQIQNKLAAAIRDGQIQPCFQPIVSAQDGTVVGVEVLARWHDGELGEISPTLFIPLAENTGLIGELGQRIWQAALAAGRDWRQAGCPLRLAINISMRQLFSAHFAQHALDDVKQHALSPGDIVLEVTESIASGDVEHATARLRELRQSGFHIAIDDFGTGYSSLSQLHELQAHELKIDVSFIRRIDDPGGRSMIQAIIQLARALHLDTVAEGVEDSLTADRLRRMGASRLQGYHFGRPMPREEFERLFLRPAGEGGMAVVE